jgi:hypothetical protein
MKSLSFIIIGLIFCTCSKDPVTAPVVQEKTDHSGRYAGNALQYTYSDSSKFSVTYRDTLNVTINSSNILMNSNKVSFTLTLDPSTESFTGPRIHGFFRNDSLYIFQTIMAAGLPYYSFQGKKL